MKSRLALLHKQQGVAVITALLLTTLAITIVASLFWQQQVQVRSIENQRLQLQKQWILRGALDWASLILREDAKHSSDDNLDEPWAVPLAETRLDQYVENGRSDSETSDATLSGSISDAQARFNLKNLSVNGNIIKDEVAAFERLLNNQKIDAKLAQASADLMADAQKIPVALMANQNPAPQPMNPTQVEDLLTVPGFTPAILNVLKPFVIFLPVVTPVNVNTAPVEVIAAKFNLTLSDASTLIKSRNTATFKDRSDFNARLPGKNLAASEKEASVFSSYFLVNGKVHMSRAGLNMQALIERNAGQTKLISIREF
ncbi:MAG: type II secretion system minor pseudopilin GspK [Gallionella sp.]|nr:type II secretion system minor pseudopilin GspK [Gallionella sp.]